MSFPSPLPPSWVRLDPEHRCTLARWRNDIAAIEGRFKTVGATDATVHQHFRQTCEPPEKALARAVILSKALTFLVANRDALDDAGAGVSGERSDYASPELWEALYWWFHRTEWPGIIPEPDLERIVSMTQCICRIDEICAETSKRAGTIRG